MDDQSVSEKLDPFNDDCQTVIGKLKKKLLDLTNRNRLISYTHAKTSSLRIIDELPDQLVTTLLNEKNQMSFRPVPEPTEEELIQRGYLALNEETGEITKLKDDPSAEQWAKEMYGLNTSYQMPAPDDVSGDDDKHTDTNIQALLYPHELEPRLKSLYTKAKSSIDETGLNILYLMFGFVQWYESSSSDRARIAPLFFVPVTLQKGQLDSESKTYRYRVSYSGEEIIENQSLIMKMRNDFGLAFPEQDEGALPEEYFTQVETAIRNKSRWSIKRYVTLGLLSFRKQVLVGDLTPDVCDSHVIKEFLAGEGDGDEEDHSYDDEYEVDKEEEVHNKYPLIFDADSSQHSVVIDALSGKSLVVEGPPGTGKSQTITNLIAGAIANGKKVLFVAEKLAALEVVKSRLDEAGLGDFCLELHSHKSRRSEVYDSISKRLDKRNKFKNPKDIDVEIEGYETLKRQLIAHVENIAKKWRRTEITVGEILNRATRYRLLFGNEDVATPDVHNHFYGDTFTPLNRRLLEEKISSVLDIEKVVEEKLSGEKRLNDHPWFGVKNPRLVAYQSHEISTLLRDWNQSLQSTESAVRGLYSLLGIDSESVPSVADAQQLAKDLSEIPEIDDRVELSVAVDLLGDAFSDAKSHLELFHKIEIIGADIAKKLQSAEVVNDKVRAAALIGHLEALDKTFSINPALSELGKYHELTETVVAEISKISSVLNELMRVFGRSFSGKHEDLLLINNIIQAVISLEQREWGRRDDRYDNDDIDTAVPEIKESLEKITEELKRVEGNFDVDKLLDAESLSEIKAQLDAGGLFKIFKSNWRKAKRDLLAMSAKSGGNFDRMQALLEEAIMVRDVLKEINSNKFYQDALGDLLDAHRTELDHIEKMRDWYKQVRTQFGSGFGPMVQVGSQILTMDKSTFKAIAEQENLGLRDRIDTISELWKKCKAAFSASTLSGLTAPFADNGHALQKIGADLKEKGTVVSAAIKDQELKLNEIGEISNGLVEHWKRVDQWNASKYSESIYGGSVLEVGMSADDPERIAVESTITLAEYLHNTIKTQRVKDAVIKKLSREWIESLEAPVKELIISITEQDLMLTAFSKKVDLDFVRWTKGNDQLFQLIDRNNNALESVDELGSWISYIQSRGELVEQGFEPIIVLLEMGEIDGDGFKAGCMNAVYLGLAKEIFDQNNEIRTFSGVQQTALQKRFIEYDKKIIELQRERIAWRADQNHVPKGSHGLRAGDLTELHMIEHQCNLTRPSAPIRRLIDQAGDALKALMPCFMMSPMSAANYVKRSAGSFDLLIMDEASQIRPEDAFGVISKADQVVIVGDQKQLPPTNFFNSAMIDDGDEEDDEMILDGPESILEMASTRFASRRLRWHYRSQHESLIAFSNSRFYNDDLVIFPSPHNQSKDYGIQFERIKNGVFQNHRNLEEVKVIVESVKNHVIHALDESLGIVAMNTHQMDAIERGIESAIKSDTEFEINHQTFVKNKGEIFIKNLETVQGDERDVIFISMTYGPPKAGVSNVYQRFGPINKELGWRRLNVLFTRSRKRMHIFSSMGSESIQIGPNTKRGVREMRNFFKYCETGELAIEDGDTGRPPDSDFEIAVANELEKHGYECKAQIGVSGFFIDLAVVDPYMPSRYLCGVECDGATYHSAKSARDRDRLRQEILERLGWRIRRIWSTDWFMNPQAELRPLLDELEQLKAASKQEVGEYVEEAETEVIDEIVDAADQKEDEVGDVVDTEAFLQEQLEQFNLEVVVKEEPDTPSARRLLRPAMIEALVEHTPIDEYEFLELIPGYLRQSIDPKEGKYLTSVFSIINNSLG